MDFHPMTTEISCLLWNVQLAERLSQILQRSFFRNLCDRYCWFYQRNPLCI